MVIRCKLSKLGFAVSPDNHWDHGSLTEKEVEKTSFSA